MARLSYADTPDEGRRGARPAMRVNGVVTPLGAFVGGRAWTLAYPGRLGPPDLVVVFRGSDDAASWLTAIRDIDAAWPPFAGLVGAIESRAQAGGRIVLVGHSLGGAMVQLFMYEHPNDPHYAAVTFGSPGALPKPHLFAARSDNRITNYVVSDDPFVFLGEHRAELRRYAMRHPLRALWLAMGVARASGASLLRVLLAAGDMRRDYVNNGRKVVLPGASPALTLAGLAGADPDEHEIETYIARTAQQPVAAGACAAAAGR